MNTFEFFGEWEFELDIPAFARHKGKGAVGEIPPQDPHPVSVRIEDQLDDALEPSPEQVQALNRLLQQADVLYRALCQQVFEDYDHLQDGYDYTPSEMSKIFPKLQSPEAARKVFGIGSVLVMCAHKDGEAYLGLTGGCTWDDEHGIGFLVHKGRVLAMGDVDAGLDTDAAMKDNGTYEAYEAELKAERAFGFQHPMPKTFPPHPVFGTYKPSHEEANQDYGSLLIFGGFNAEFIHWMETEGPAPEVRPRRLPALLQAACRSGNLEIVNFLLSQGVTELKGCMLAAGPGCSIPIAERILGLGGDINERDHQGGTPIGNVTARILELHSQHGATQEALENAKSMWEWMIRHGANPHLKAPYRPTAVEAFQRFPMAIRAAYVEWAADLVRRFAPPGA